MLNNLHKKEKKERIYEKVLDKESILVEQIPMGGHLCLVTNLARLHSKGQNKSAGQ